MKITAKQYNRLDQQIDLAAERTAADYWLGRDVARTRAEGRVALLGRRLDQYEQDEDVRHLRWRLAADVLGAA